MKKPTKKSTRAARPAAPENPELEAVAARADEMETAAAEAAQDVFAEPAPPPPDPIDQLVSGIPEGDPGVMMVAIAAVDEIGAVATTLTRTPPLTEPESGRLAKAIVNLFAQYDLDKMPPKSAAWVAFGLCFVGIALPRAKYVAERMQTPRAPVEHDAAAGA